jgi:hypothetical protein
MPSVSQQQQKLFGLALAVKRGEVPRSEASQDILDIVDSMSEKDIEDFASTKHAGLPKKVEEKLREMVRNMMRESIIGEGLFQDIMKGVKTGNGPFTLVVIKNNKVVKQVTVNTPQGVPANYTSLQKDYPNSRIRVEDATGKIVFGESIEEAKKGDFEMGDFVHFKSANKTGMVKKISGDKITIMTMKGDYTGDIKDIQVLYQDGVEPSLNESSVEIGDVVFLKSANKIATVVDRFGRSVTVKTGDGKKVKTVINKVRPVEEDDSETGGSGDYVSIGFGRYKEKGKENDKSAPYFTKDDSGKFVKNESTQINEWRAEDVLQQLGGKRFILMTGANKFVKNDSEKSITFKLPRAKSSIKYVKITLTSMDLYDVEFIAARGTNIKTVAKVKGVYNDQLQQVFTQHTGLYTRL